MIILTFDFIVFHTIEENTFISDHKHHGNTCGYYNYSHETDHIYHEENRVLTLM